MGDIGIEGGERCEDLAVQMKNVRQLQPTNVGSANTSELSTSAGSNDFGSKSYTTASSKTDSVNSNAKHPTFKDTSLPNASDHSIVRSFEPGRISTYSRSSTGLNSTTSESEAAIETDSEDDIDESAIEEEDSDDDDWEDDDNEESGPPSVADRPLFQRVDSKPNLTSRRSLLTSALHQDDRALALQDAASRPSPATRRSRTSIPNGPSTGNSPQEDSGLMMMRSQVSRPKPIIMTTSNVHPPAMSPKTTRRNMLTSELTRSLRQNLLWERQQNNATTNAVAKRQPSAANLPALRRAMTTGDIKGLNNNTNEQQAAKSDALKDDSKPSSTYNQFFDSELNDYHKSGW